jgi:hypothetical protein
MEVWFAAVEPFGPQCGESWDKYVEFSHLTQLREVVSLDDSLCPCVIKELTDEDWEFNVAQDYVCFYFRDLDYLIKRIGRSGIVNILPVVRDPQGECKDYLRDERFEFMGYDLIEVNGGTSALTNCGGFDRAFRSEELSGAGLITSFERAHEVQRLLRENYPAEPHANCDLWAIWKMKEELEAGH